MHIYNAYSGPFWTTHSPHTLMKWNETNDMKRTISFCAHIFVMVVTMIFERMMIQDFFFTVRFRFNGSTTTLHWKPNLSFKWFSLPLSSLSLSAFICSEQAWYTHIWLWSAIWISSSVFVVTFFCPFFIIFHSSQRQSILLPVKWPCIFFTCISYVYIFFSFCFVCVCFCYGFQFIASSVSLARPSMHYLNLERNADPNLLTLSSAYYIFQSFNYSFRLHDFDHAISYAGLIIITCNACGMNALLVFYSFTLFVCLCVTMNVSTLKSRSRKLQLWTKAVSKSNNNNSINNNKGINRNRLRTVVRQKKHEIGYQPVGQQTINTLDL